MNGKLIGTELEDQLKASIAKLKEKPKPAKHKKVAEYHKVESDTIAALGYNPETRTMGVAFLRNRAIYLYHDISYAIFKKVLKAKSVGSELARLHLTSYTRVQ